MGLASIISWISDIVKNDVLCKAIVMQGLILWIFIKKNCCVCCIQVHCFATKVSLCLSFYFWSYLFTLKEMTTNRECWLLLHLHCSCYCNIITPHRKLEQLCHMLQENTASPISTWIHQLNNLSHAAKKIECIFSLA